MPCNLREKNISYFVIHDCGNPLETKGPSLTQKGWRGWMSQAQCWGVSPQHSVGGLVWGHSSERQDAVQRMWLSCVWSLKQSLRKCMHQCISQLDVNKWFLKDRANTPWTLHCASVSLRALPGMSARKGNPEETKSPRTEKLPRVRVDPVAWWDETVYKRRENCTERES